MPTQEVYTNRRDRKWDLINFPETRMLRIRGLIKHTHTHTHTQSYVFTNSFALAESEFKYLSGVLHIGIFLFPAKVPSLSHKS